MKNKSSYDDRRSKYASLVVLWTLILFMIVCLFGCAKQTTPTETVANSAKESITALVAAKPECKDVGNVCNSQIESIVASCDLEVSSINKDLIKWKWSFWGLLIVVAAYLIKKILK